MIRTRLLVGSTLLLPVLLLTTAACSNSNTSRGTSGEASREASPGGTLPNTGVAYVRYINALDAHSNTDLYFGNTKVMSSTDQNSGYVQVPAERRDFALRASNNPNGVDIVKNSEGLTDGKHYTVVAYEDAAGKPVIRVVKDDESAPESGKAKVRIIHAAPATEAIGLYVGGSKNKIAGESRYSTESSWQNVDPVKSPLELRTTDSKARVRVTDTQLAPGKLYTFIVTGGKKTGEPVRVTTLVDTPSKA